MYLKVPGERESALGNLAEYQPPGQSAPLSFVHDYSEGLRHSGPQEPDVPERRLSTVRSVWNVDFQNDTDPEDPMDLAQHSFQVARCSKTCEARTAFIDSSPHGSG